MDRRIFTESIVRCSHVTSSSNCHYSYYDSNYYCYNTYDTYQPDVGTIIGIAAGCIFGLALFVGITICIIVFVCNQNRRQPGVVIGGTPAVVYNPHQQSQPTLGYVPHGGAQSVQPQGYGSPQPGVSDPAYPPSPEENAPDPPKY